MYDVLFMVIDKNLINREITGMEIKSQFVYIWIGYYWNDHIPVYEIDHPCKNRNVCNIQSTIVEIFHKTLIFFWMKNIVASSL